MPIIQAELNKCATNAATFLARILAPRIENLQSIEQDDYCQIRLNNLFQPDRPLHVDTRNSEITLEFGECHCHFSTCQESVTEDQLVGQMVEKIVRIVGDFERSYSAWSGGRCLGGGWLEGQEGDRKMVRDFPLANRFLVIGWVLENNMEITRDSRLGLGGECADRSC